jgi:hypothetical protein
MDVTARQMDAAAEAVSVSVDCLDGRKTDGRTLPDDWMPLMVIK